MTFRLRFGLLLLTAAAALSACGPAAEEGITAAVRLGEKACRVRVTLHPDAVDGLTRACRQLLGREEIIPPG